MTEDGDTTLDVTRLQMLLFTMIAAGFVLTIMVVREQIPNIPHGVVAIIGISNGIYIGKKSIPSRGY